MFLFSLEFFSRTLKKVPEGVEMAGMQRTVTQVCANCATVSNSYHLRFPCNISYFHSLATYANFHGILTAKMGS